MQNSDTFGALGELAHGDKHLLNRSISPSPGAELPVLLILVSPCEICVFWDTCLTQIGRLLVSRHCLFSELEIFCCIMQLSWIVLVLSPVCFPGKLTTVVAIVSSIDNLGAEKNKCSRERGGGLSNDSLQLVRRTDTTHVFAPRVSHFCQLSCKIEPTGGRGENWSGVPLPNSKKSFEVCCGCCSSGTSTSASVATKQKLCLYHHVLPGAGCHRCFDCRSEQKLSDLFSGLLDLIEKTLGFYLFLCRMAYASVLVGIEMI